jgi:hypothetical protein
MQEQDNNLPDGWVNIDLAKVLVKDNVMYVKRCIECNKKLTADEASYGHDCE